MSNNPNKSNWDNIYNQAGYMHYPNEALVVSYHRIKHLLPKHVCALDYGFGSGNNSEFIIGKVNEFHGIEISAPAIDLASKRLNKFEHFDAKNLLLANNEFQDDYIDKFDLIVAWHVISYNSHSSLITVIDHFHHYLKKGGLLITTLATPRDISSKCSDQVGHNTFVINEGISNQQGCQVVIPQNQEDFAAYFNKFDVLDIGHEERMSYKKDDFHSHYYGIFKK